MFIAEYGDEPASPRWFRSVRPINKICKTQRREPVAKTLLSYFGLWLMCAPRRISRLICSSVVRSSKRSQIFDKADLHSCQRVKGAPKKYIYKFFFGSSSQSVISPAVHRAVNCWL